MSENKITRKKCAQDGKNLIKSRYYMTSEAK